MDTAPPTPKAPAGTTVLVSVLALAGIAVSLMQTLVIPLIPELPRLLNASASDSAWVITATLLAVSVATPVVGKLGDMYGKRRMLLVSLGLMVIGSVVGALSHSLPPMIVGRILQGASAGVIPLGISLMRDEVAPEKLGSATAVMSSSLGVGGALGLPAAAVLVEHADWHYLFWTSGAVGALVAVLVVLLVPASPVRTGGRFDLVGAIGLSAVLVCALLAISKGGDWGWTSGLTLGLLGAAVVLLAAWGWWEQRVREPLVDLRISARRQVLLTNAASIGIGVAVFSMALVIPTVVQLPTATGFGLGKSLLTLGLVMLPSGLLTLVTSPIAARIAAVRGFKFTLILGAIVMAAGYVVAIGVMSQLWGLVLASCFIGAGLGFAYGSMPALVMAAVPISETASANSLNTLMRGIGTSVASAVGGAVLAHLTITVGAATFPAQSGFRIVLAIAGCAALVAAGIAAFLPTARRTPPIAQPVTTAEPAAA